MSECRKPPPLELAATTVLTIPELLEPILLGLDMRTLLTSALRVCRQWRDLIQGSTLLQRALFFECEERPAGSQEVTFNPLLAGLFPIFFDVDGPRESRGFNDLAIEALPIGQRRVAFYRRDASWRRMHVRQPPVKHVGLWTQDHISTRKENFRMLKYDRGLRMESFYFLALKHVYWWDVFVKWGDDQGRRLPHLDHLRTRIVQSTEKMLRTADVIIGGLAAHYCIIEGDARRHVDSKGMVQRMVGRYAVDNDRIDEERVRKSVESNGLVKMGIFWFKARETKNWEIMWEDYSGDFCCLRHGNIDRVPYAIPL